MRTRMDARTVPFLAVLMAIGFADAITGSYLVLFATDQLHLDPIEVGVATSVFTLTGIVFGVAAGRRVDRLRARWPLVAGLVIAAAGFAAFTVVRGFVPLLVVCALAGAINVGFPQVFALEHMSRRTEATGATALLRGGWSIAWAAGPVLAAGLVLWLGYDALFALAAVLLVAGAIGVRGLPRPTAAVDHRGAVGRPAWSAVALPVAAVMLFHTALFANAIAVGALVSGIAAGVLVEVVGLRATLAVCAGLATLAAACVLLDVGIRRRATAVPGPA